MPNDKSKDHSPYGSSHEFTPHKWERYGEMIKMNARMWKGVPFRHGPYNLYDFYSGPGILSKEDVPLAPQLAGSKGSPILGLEMLHRIYPGPVEAYFFDEYGPYTARLATNLTTFQDDIKIRCLEFRDAIRWLIRTLPFMDGRHGLAFFDPCGIPDWAGIREFARSRWFKTIDLMINVNSTASKRLRRSTSECHRKADYKLKPSEHLEGLRKKNRMVWEPCLGDVHQFALLYLTNGPMPTWKESGFYPINSIEGRRIMRRVDLSHEERIAAGGQTGFFPGFE